MQLTQLQRTANQREAGQSSWVADRRENVHDMVHIGPGRVFSPKILAL